MENHFFFERNLLALARSDAPLCARLSAALTTRGTYKFLVSRSGAPVPAFVDRAGSAHPLHSLVDPHREAQRLLATIQDGGFLLFLGLGGGYALEAALSRPDVQGVTVIEYGIDGVAELLASMEYLRALSDPRFVLLVDPGAQTLRDHILSAYRPALSGGISVIPLRTRVDQDPEAFEAATRTVRAAINTVSEDYSVQAYFGKRWFANTLRNLDPASAAPFAIPPERRIIVTAAGPSLDLHLQTLRTDTAKRYLIATDTSLPALLAAGVRIDAVVSIDCQHISYYHFMDGLPGEIPLFLDLASPPVLASRSRMPRFFSGGHPLTQYISRHWRPLPLIDTSGGNVTYAAVSLADALGADRIELYGADFSYPEGDAYAKGTYIHPYYQRAQTRLAPLEALFVAFLFRNETLERRESDGTWRYETKPLAGYRERLENLSPTLRAELVVMPGRGAPIKLRPGKPAPRTIPLFSSGRSGIRVPEFLALYRRRIARIPRLRGSVASYLAELNAEDRDVLTTLLPSAAAVRRREATKSAAETLEAVRSYCLDEIDRVLGSMG